jgi:putative RecB family exonuclease
VIALAPGIPAMPPVQSEEDRIDDLLKTISASRLSTFLQCRLRFFFQYVLKIERQKSSSLHVGSTVHEVLKQWNKARWRGTVVSEEQYQVMFNDAWTHPENDEVVKWESEEEQEKKAQGWNLLLTYFAHSPLKAGVKPEGVEVYAQADLAAHGLPILTGVLDLVQ